VVFDVGREVGSEVGLVVAPFGWFRSWFSCRLGCHLWVRGLADGEAANVALGDINPISRSAAITLRIILLTALKVRTDQKVPYRAR
jgi:hypothetical protein